MSLRSRRRIRSATDEAPGQDSFLDIVANLVGILIILVLVVGVRAKDAWVDKLVSQPPPEAAELQQNIQQMRDETRQLETDINQLAEKVKLVEATVALRRAERDRLQLLITAVERELNEQRSKLQAGDQQLLQLQSAIRLAQAELDRTRQQQQALQSSAAPVEVIEHIPTPMAKTVFGKEVHFRLLGGRLAYVPLDELVEKMKQEIRFKAERLRTSPSTVETIGPIAGFHLRYMLRLAERVEETRIGIVRAQVPEFVGFYLIPTSDQLGEPLQQALEPSSQFHRMIDGLDPNTTTITVWVYPDSFKEFLILKRYLYQRGFLTACWPLPEGHPISGGPHGRRSAAQ